MPDCVKPHDTGACPSPEHPRVLGPIFSGFGLQCLRICLQYTALKSLGSRYKQFVAWGFSVPIHWWGGGRAGVDDNKLIVIVIMQAVC